MAALPSSKTLRNMPLDTPAHLLDEQDTPNTPGQPGTVINIQVTTSNPPEGSPRWN